MKIIFSADYLVGISYKILILSFDYTLIIVHPFCPLAINAYFSSSSKKRMLSGSPSVFGPTEIGVTLY